MILLLVCARTVYTVFGFAWPSWTLARVPGAACLLAIVSVGPVIRRRAHREGRERATIEKHTRV